MPRANRYGPGIIKQRGTFYATRQVPKRLQDRVGRKRLVKTLQTDSLSEARRRAPIVLAEFDALLDEPKESLDVQWFRRMAETMTNGNRELILDILDTEINERYGPTEVEQTPEDRAESERIIEAVLSPLTESYIDDYLQTKQTQELRPITIRRMRTELAMLANRFPYVHQIAKKDVAEWVDELMSTLSSNTVRKYASTWRQYYGYLMRRDIVDEGSNPFAVTVRDNRKRSRVVRQAFTATQIKTLLHESARDSILHDFILFAAYTGCRVGEIGSLRIEDLNGDAVTIHDAKTKAGNRTVPLSHQLLPMVLRRIGNRSSGFVFDYDSNMETRAGAPAKRFSILKNRLGFGPELVFHSIRKTVATCFQNGGVPEKTAAAILGHKINTMSYGLYSAAPSMEEKRKAVEVIRY